MRALVAGWFSFEWMGATAGDLMARDVACRWLEKAGCPFDIATAPPFSDGIDWRTADPCRYTHVLFVCGPFGNGEPVTEFLQRFSGSRLVGLDLSMLQPVDEWNPFDLLLERDSSRGGHPDLSFLSAAPKVPVVGSILVHPQREYGARGRHREVHEVIERLLSSRECSIVPIDTCLDPNKTGLRTAAEVESLIARMDVVVTTRLHGTVLALKNGVPVVAVDPIAGGAKITRQAATLEWPAVFTPETVTDAALAEAFDWCLTGSAAETARRAGRRGVHLLGSAEEAFLAFMQQTRSARGS